MRWTSVLAVHLLIWWLVVFAVMPFGIRTHSEMGEELIPGQSHSAPANFRPRRVVLFTTAISTVLMALFYFNHANRWVTVHSLLWLFPLPVFMTGSA